VAAGGSGSQSWCQGRGKGWVGGGRASSREYRRSSAFPSHCLVSVKDVQQQILQGLGTPRARHSARQARPKRSRSQRMKLLPCSRQQLALPAGSAGERKGARRSGGAGGGAEARADSNHTASLESKQRNFWGMPSSGGAVGCSTWLARRKSGHCATFSDGFPGGMSRRSRSLRRTQQRGPDLDSRGHVCRAQARKETPKQGL